MNKSILSFDDFAKRLVLLKDKELSSDQMDSDGWIDIEKVDNDIYQSMEAYLIKYTRAGAVPNYSAFNLLKEYDIDVGPGETDSFGWLTGVIYLGNKKKILFG